MVVLKGAHGTAEEVHACADQHEQAGSAVSALVLREVARWLEGKGPLPAPPKLSAFAPKREAPRVAPEHGEPSDAAVRLAQCLVRAKLDPLTEGTVSYIARELDAFVRGSSRGA